MVYIVFVYSKTLKRMCRFEFDTIETAFSVFNAMKKKHPACICSEHYAIDWNPQYKIIVENGGE